jgi:hypothetical protein
MATLNTIEVEKIEETIKEATAAGYTAYIIINGEYYEIKK